MERIITGKEKFSSFEIQRALKKKRATFQSALGAGHIKGNVRVGRGKGTANQWDIDGFCGVKLFFDMVEFGRPRFMAETEIFEIDWSNVGQEKDQVKYMVFFEKDSEHPNLKHEGGWKTLNKWPQPDDINGLKTRFMVIDVLQIKKDVYKLAEKIIADRKEK